MRQKIKNIFQLGLKELRGLGRDPLMLGLILYTFTIGVYIAATAKPDSITKAALAIVDEDNSQLSQRIGNAFFLPMFLPPEHIVLPKVDPVMDQGQHTFVLVIPPDFQKDVIAGNQPALQLNVDATRMSQAFTGSGYIQQIVMKEIHSFVSREDSSSAEPASIVVRNRFNPNLVQAWFGGMTEMINNITMLAIILTGAALIREREHGTLEHLLVMPVTPFEIMASKIWAMALVVMCASGLSLLFVIQGALGAPVEGSKILFMAGTLLHLFATTSMGIFLASMARNMPQLGMLLLLVLLPMQMLSGGVTPRESMPRGVQLVMELAPTTHFMELSQGILFRGAGLDVVWPSFLALALIGTVLFVISLICFRRTVAQVS